MDQRSAWFHDLSTSHQVIKEGYRLELGLGKAKAIEGVVIHWHGSGLVQDVEGIQVDTWVTVTEGDPQPLSRPLKGFEMTQAASPHEH